MEQDSRQKVEIPNRHTSLDTYTQARDALVEAEHSRSFDYTATLTASPLEKKANTIIRNLITLESSTLYGVQGDGSGHEPAHQFGRSKPVIERSKIFAIAKRAPKGCLLHCHFDAMLHPIELLSIATGMKNMGIKTDAALTHRGFFEHASPTFQVLSRELVERCKGVSVFEQAYVPGEWMLYDRFREEFPGGGEKADEWVSGKIVLHVDDVYHSSQTVNGIWKTFGRSFHVILGLLRYETAWREYFRRLLWNLAHDKISYAEMRAGFNTKRAVYRDDGETKLNQHEMIQILSDVLDEEIPKIREAGLTFYGVKFIYAALRFIERDDMLWDINNVIEMKQAHPDLICGFDMCGQEDSGRPLKYWIPELLEMRKKCDSLGLDLPFIFHAGETLDHGGDTDSNLFDAVLLGTKRIGHGFSLTKHPLLLEICREREIVVEMCPISNEVLGLCGSVTGHPLPVLLAGNVPCTVNSDDPGVFHSTLSHDFYQIMIGSNKMSLIGWRVLIEWSFKYSMMSEEEKAERLMTFRKEWEEFCQEIVDEYGKMV